MADRELMTFLNDALNQRLDDVREQMQQGFDGVHARLDKLNGRTLEAEREIERIRTTWKTITAIYGVIITLLGLSGGCVWLKQQAPRSISVGGNSAAGTEQPIR